MSWPKIAFLGKSSLSSGEFWIAPSPPSRAPSPSCIRLAPSFGGNVRARAPPILTGAVDRTCRAQPGLESSGPHS